MRRLEELYRLRDAIRARIDYLEDEAFNLEAKLTELDKEISREARKGK